MFCFFFTSVEPGDVNEQTQSLDEVSGVQSGVEDNLPNRPSPAGEELPTSDGRASADREVVTPSESEVSPNALVSPLSTCEIILS